VSPVLRICLVTAEFHGLFKNGGIGTANTGLALELAAAGHEVTVAYVDPGAWSSLPGSEAFLAARVRWRERGVFLDVVPRWARLKVNVDDYCWSLSVLEYLRGRRFELVLFNECGGQGYYSLLAKRAGVFSHPPRMIVVTHGASEWARELNGQLPGGHRAPALAFFERRSVELADVAVSPSRYLVGWMRERGWRLPETVEVLQNVVPVDAAAPTDAAPADVDEIVFFGRLESRKGLGIFCDAIEALDRSGRLGKAGVTFLGKFSRTEGVHSGVFLIERARSWSVTPRILANLGQEEALDYLKRPGVLAVMPSLAENSPCVVVECLLAGVPFVATDGGGTGELVAEADRAACLVAPDGAALAARLGQAIAQGAPRARLAEPQALTRSRWRALVETSDPPAPPQDAAPPRVSVCISAAFGAEIEPLALDAIRRQTHADVELVVVVYEADADRRTQVGPREIHIARRSPDRAAARNAAAAAASSEWLAFVRERDLLLEPHALTTLVEAARRLQTQAISGFALEHNRPGLPNPDWDGEMGTAPIGPCMLLAAFENCLGDEVFLISSSAFEALGGYESGVAQAIEDRLLLTRAMAQGRTLDLVPAPLAWRRAGPVGQGDDVADVRRVLQVFAQAPLGDFAPVVESVLAQGPLQARLRATSRLASLDPPSRDLALALTFDYLAGAPESFPAFVRYCLARSRFVEALDFARSHDWAALKPLVDTALARETDRSARRGPRAEARATPITLSMKPELVARLRLQTAPEGAVLTRDAHCIASLRLLHGMTVAKAPLACPPGTKRLTAWLDFAAQGVLEAEVAIAVADPAAQALLTETGPAPGAGVWWSGWRPATREPVGLELDALPPSSTPRDVFLLGRNAMDDEVWAVWRDVRGHGSVSDLATPSTLSPAELRHKLPLRILERGEVLTDTSDFPYAVWIPGEWTLHHPLAGRVCIVRVPQAIPPGGFGVAASFSTRHEQAHPIAFAFWLSPATADPRPDPALAETSNGSGWTVCAEPFQTESMELRLERPAAAAMDLYLATQVIGFDDVGWCHAVWREISVIELVMAG
jgi:glycosyltransferase involved in cell wall biosynthesis